MPFGKFPSVSSSEILTAKDEQDIAYITACANADRIEADFCKNLKNPDSMRWEPVKMEPYKTIYFSSRGAGKVVHRLTVEELTRRLNKENWDVWYSPDYTGKFTSQTGGYLVIFHPHLSKLRKLWIKLTFLQP